MSRVQTNRLTEQEFLATMRPGMVDILGKEDQEEPGWAIDIEPYLAAIPKSEFIDHPLANLTSPAAVRRNRQDGFDHVLCPVLQNNTYLVVVVRYREGTVLGHYILDLRVDAD